jgi:hypothetical protein
MFVCIIISTYGSRIHNLKLPSKVYGVCYLIIHQSPSLFDVNVKFDRTDVKYLPTLSSGLSTSRNIGLSLCPTRYAYIMDDDVIFDQQHILDITTIMAKDKVDIGTCKFQYENGRFPTVYRDHSFDHDIFTAAKVSSIEICVNVESLRKHDIEFDENFGLGTDLPSGEEYVFLTDCIKKGLKVRYYPIITGVHPNETSGMDFYTDYHKTFAKREMLIRIFKWRSFFLIVAFWFKKIMLVKRAGYALRFTKTLLLGIR